MSRLTPRGHALYLWVLGVTIALVGVFLVLGLGTVAPVFMANSVAGVGARLAVCAVCLTVFFAAHRYGRHSVRRP